MPPRVKLPEQKTEPEESKQKRYNGALRPIGQGGGTIRYRPAPSDIFGKTEIRRYFIGAVPLCFVEIFEEDASPTGTYVCHIPSRPGNSGRGFKTEAEMHTFIFAELQREIT